MKVRGEKNQGFFFSKPNTYFKKIRDVFKKTKRNWNNSKLWQKRLFLSVKVDWNLCSEEKRFPKFLFYLFNISFLKPRLARTCGLYSSNTFGSWTECSLIWKKTFFKYFFLNSLILSFFYFWESRNVSKCKDTFNGKFQIEIDLIKVWK